MDVWMPSNMPRCVLGYWVNLESYYEELLFYVEDLEL
jgi:hypothetical protein